MPAEGGAYRLSVVQNPPMGRWRAAGAAPVLTDVDLREASRVCERDPEASVLAAAYVLFVGMVIYRHIGLKDILPIFVRTAVFSSVIMILFGVVGIFSRILAMERVGDAFGQWILSVAPNAVVFLLIVNIFFVFFVAPLFGLELSPFAAVTVGLSVWGSANGIEIVRGGLNAVPRHQWQSAAALGLKTWEIYLFIIGPQALRAILPPFVGLLTLLVQATSLGALVGVNEFFKVGQIIVERTTMMEGWNPAFTVYAAVLLTYFVICSTLSWFGRWLERRLKRERQQARPAALARAEPAAQLP